MNPTTGTFAVAIEVSEFMKGGNPWKVTVSGATDVARLRESREIILRLSLLQLR